jgi:hypothetical protein
MKTIYFLFFGLLFYDYNLSAQNYEIDNINTPVTTCNGTFYASGGPSANYSNNENYIATFCAPSGHYISFNFYDLNLEANDTLFIYDGNNIQGTLLGAFNGTAEPPVFFSTYEGCLTFNFKSNSSGQSSGKSINGYFFVIWSIFATLQSPLNIFFFNNYIVFHGSYIEFIRIRIIGIIHDFVRITINKGCFYTSL